MPPSSLWLDCHDVDSALGSLAVVTRAEPVQLRRSLIDYDEARFVGSESPYGQMPREVLESLGTTLEVANDRLAGACYFHGTRAIDPSSFRTRGILPLDLMIEEIWATLRALASERTDAEWARFRAWVEGDGGGDWGHLYRLKTAKAIHYGPHGELVREVFLDPSETSSHDYLGCPEIVEDIAFSYADAFGVDLGRRFCDATRPCLVKFRADLWSGAVETGLWYLYSKLRDQRLGRNSCGGHAGDGVAVPADDVVDVAIVQSDH